MTNGSSDRRPPGIDSSLRDAAPEEIATILRAVLGLNPHQPHPEEISASLGRPLPQMVYDLRAGSWLAWCLVGLPLFGEAMLPTVKQAHLKTKRLLVALALIQAKGNITHAAKALRISRRSCRTAMKAVGLYPWPPGGF